MRTITAIAAAALAALGLASFGAAAQDFPTRAITLIVPWPAGGSTDTHMRKLAELASKHLGQPIIVENKPGAGGMLGPAAMAKNAAPDGYTISQLTVNALRQPHMLKVDWDPFKDFTWIIGVSGYTFGMVVKNDSPMKSFDDVVKYAKANPGKFSFSSTGIGTSPHLLIEQVADKAGVQLLHVPFKGTGDALAALLSGDVDMTFSSTGSAMPQVKAGKLVLLAVGGWMLAVRIATRRLDK